MTTKAATSGKTLAEISEWLATNPPKTKRRYGNEYIPIGIVIKDLTDFLGPAGFSTKCTPPEIVKQHVDDEGKEISQFSVVVRLSIYPEDSHPIERTAPGGAWAWNNPQGRYGGLTAEAHGIRRAASLMGRRFGMDLISDADLYPESPNGAESREDGSGQANPPNRGTRSNTSRPPRQSRPHGQKGDERPKDAPVTQEEIDELLLTASNSDRGSNEAVIDFVSSKFGRAAVTGEVWADSLPAIAEQLVNWQFEALMRYLNR